MLIQTREQFDAALTTLFDADVIAVDTETFYIQKGVEPVQMGVAVYCPVKGREMEAGFYLPFRHEHSPTLLPSVNLPLDWLRELNRVLVRDDVTILFHNAKFDIPVLKRDGIDLTQSDFYDTMLMSHMSNENPPHGLKPLGKKLLGIEDTEKKALDKLARGLGDDKLKGVARKADGWRQVPPDAMGLYAVQDVRLTYLLWKHFMKDLEEQELLELWPREREFCRFLIEVEENGVLVNSLQAMRLAEECRGRRAEILDALGFDPMKPDQLARKLFAPAPEGLGFQPGPLGESSPAFPRGRPKMDKHILARYDHPVVQSVLEYRGLVKAEGTWFQGFLAARWPDGRVHPDFRQHGTVTTRLSCSDPNLQQLPREDEDDPEDAPMKAKVKTIVEAPDGYEVWEYDYSQLEPRLATAYSKEPALVYVYENGLDIYQDTADRVGVSRYQAKQLWLAMMYGAGVRKVAEMLGVLESESKEIVSEFRAAYPMLSSTIANCADAATARGWIRLWTGRKRHFLWPSECYKAFNSLMQGGGAEIVKDTCLRLRNALPKEVRIISMVHDSVWFEIPEGRHDLHAIIKKTMEWPTEEFSIPFPVEAKRLDKVKVAL